MDNLTEFRLPDDRNITRNFLMVEQKTVHIFLLEDYLAIPHPIFIWKDHPQIKMDWNALFCGRKYLG